MKAPLWVAGLTLVLTSALPAATVAVGQLTLQGDSNNFQDILFYNFTGIDQGCQVNGTQYQVCNAINITNWTLTVSFTNEGLSSPLSSPQTFTGTSSDIIGPYDPSVGGYEGAALTWQIPLALVNPCPPCDYEITQIVFSGTIQSVDLPLQLGDSTTYLSGDPSTYTTFSAQPTFTQTWNVANDLVFDYGSSQYVPLYSCTGCGYPGGFYDSTDVLVSDQPTVSSIPEPASLALVGVGLLLAALKRTTNR